MTLDTSTFTNPGDYTQQIFIESDDPGARLTPITLEFSVIGCNPADIAAPLGELNFFDVSAYLVAFNNDDEGADLAAPYGELNFFDVSAFLSAYTQGCNSNP